MLQIWLLYDFYFRVSYIVAKPYVVVVVIYDDADTKFSGIKNTNVQFSHNICAHKKVVIIQ